MNLYCKSVVLLLALLQPWTAEAASKAPTKPFAPNAIQDMDDLTVHEEVGDDDDDGKDGIIPSTTKRLTEDTMSPLLRKMEYAVRGTVVIKADEIARELKDETSKSKYPFDNILYTNIGNPQSVNQKPLTWPRQVLALVDLPDEV
ncbi:MAG: hypothetical protein SGARI_000328, partial [Bacillariaceae sp.]